MKLDRLDVKLTANNKQNIIQFQNQPISPIRLSNGESRPVHFNASDGGLEKKTATIQANVPENQRLGTYLAPANNSRCCPYNCFHPFEMKDKSFNIPAALFLNLIC